MTLDPEKIPIIEAGISETLKTIAGAGTGKTSVLVERYLRFVIDGGIAPSRLLALTFTIKAASEMRKRIFEEAVARGSGRPGILRELHGAWIMNFHQFSFRVIRESAASFGIDPAADVAADLDVARIRRRLRRRFEAGRIEGLPDDYEDDVPEPGRLESTFDKRFEIIDKARGTLWTPEDLLGAVRPDDAPEYGRIVRSVAALWRAYEEELRRRNLLDFADMIRIAVKGLRENARLRERYAGAFDHILVDEFQDTNEAQNELLRILSGGDFARVTVVGDDKQSIYRWRDARVRNLREFAGREHFLRTNHRSTQNILDAAHHFIVSDPYFAGRAAEIRLEAHRGSSDVPVCVFHPSDGSERSDEAEAKALAAWVLSVTGRLGADSPFACYRRVGTPVDFGGVAVLLRTLKPSSGLAAYEKAFRDAGIPYAVSGGGGAIEIRALEGLRDLLTLLVDPGDVQALLGVLESPPFALPDAHLKELFDASGAREVDGLLSDEALGKLSSAQPRGSCARLRALLEDLRDRRLALDLPAFVSYALEAGPFYYGLFDEGADERLVASAQRNLFGLVDGLVARGEANLAAFVEAVQILIEGKAVDASRGSAIPAGRVQVMTVHAAKGLQFPAVAVPGLRSSRGSSAGFHLSKTGGLYTSEAKDWKRGTEESDAYESERADHEQEERCLVYVAMTRARDHLFVSSPCPNGADRGKDPGLFGVVLDALKKNAVPHEELRAAPEIAARAAGSANGEQERGEDCAALLDAWRRERERLESARTAPVPAPDVAFVTWRQLHTFVRCPAMYRYRYVAGMEYFAETEGGTPVLVAADSDAEEISGEFHIPGSADRKTLGSLVHRILFEWMSPDGMRETPREDFVADVARRFGLGSRRDAALRREAGLMLDAFAESDLADRGTVERLEIPLEARMDRCVFRGTADRIDRARDGARIVDYKGKARRDEYGYQVRFYAWILGKTGRAVSPGACLCYLTRPVEAVSVDVSPARLEEIERGARLLEEALAAGRFEAAPGAVCGACAFNGICPDAASRGNMTAR